jgi:hypothetical protein
LITCNRLHECDPDLDGILKFKRAVTVAALSYIEYLEHFRSHAKKKQHQVLEIVGSTDSKPSTSSRGIEEKRKKGRRKIMSRKKAL